MNGQQQQYFIGLMSGTSLDGIDAALIDFGQGITTLATHFQPFSDKLLLKLSTLTKPGYDEIKRMALAEQLLAHEYALAVKTLLAKTQLQAKDIKAIGAHGQTIRHQPSTAKQRGFSTQLLDPAMLAVETGISVVADFRRKDIALNGQGAPLVPAFHQFAFASIHRHRALVNIGGIANLTFIHSSDQIIRGYDIGPGNCLMDKWFKLHQQTKVSQQYDQNGDWAASGHIHSGLLNRLLADPYFQLPPPKSTGPEYFHLHWLKSYLKDFADISAVDVQTTLVELSAITIYQSIIHENKENRESVEIYLCGGGCHNLYLKQRLEHHLKTTCQTTASLGLDPDQVEAAAFAWLAKQRITHKPGNLPSVTGATRAGILGGVYLAG